MDGTARTAPAPPDVTNLQCYSSAGQYDCDAIYTGGTPPDAAGRTDSMSKTFYCLGYE